MVPATANLILYFKSTLSLLRLFLTLDTYPSLISSRSISSTTNSSDKTLFKSINNLVQSLDHNHLILQNELYLVIYKLQLKIY